MKTYLRRRESPPEILSQAQVELLKRGLGCVVFGQKCGITKQHASLLLRGNTRPSQELADVIHRELGVDPSLWITPLGGHAAVPPKPKTVHIALRGVSAHERQELLDDLAEAYTVSVVEADRSDPYASEEARVSGLDDARAGELIALLASIGMHAHAA
jgi:transcriptional regulator with XRE-family HTH domain